MNWDQHYVEEHTPWDKGAPAPPLLEWITRHPGALGGRILVPGAGKGHDALAIRERTEAAEVVGLDIAPTAVKSASELYAREGLRFEVGDLFDLSPDHIASYDWVWEHTCFCAIDPSQRDAYVRAVHDALVPGGKLLAVFYLDPYDDEHRPGGGPPHGTSLQEISDRFETSGRFRILESFTPTNSYEGREGLEQLVLFQRLSLE